MISSENRVYGISKDILNAAEVLSTMAGQANGLACLLSYHEVPFSRADNRLPSRNELSNAQAPQQTDDARPAAAHDPRSVSRPTVPAEPPLLLGPRIGQL